MKRPARFGLIIFAGACVVALLLNIGTLAIEFNANKRVLRWLEDRLDHAPGAQDKLRQILSAVATREVGDLLKSPRYFFLTALPGTSRSRPLKREDTKDKTDV
jgi:Zn-dependent membrane protease YugP